MIDIEAAKTRIVNEIANLPPGSITDSELALLVAIQRTRNEIGSLDRATSYGYENLHGLGLKEPTPEEVAEYEALRAAAKEKVAVLQEKLRLMLIEQYGLMPIEQYGTLLKEISDDLSS